MVLRKPKLCIPLLDPFWREIILQASKLRQLVTNTYLITRWGV